MFYQSRTVAVCRSVIAQVPGCAPWRPSAAAQRPPALRCPAGAAGKYLTVLYSPGDGGSLRAIATRRSARVIRWNFIWLSTARGGSRLLAALLVFSAAGCGFELRGTGSAALPVELAAMRVIGPGGSAYPPLQVEVRNALRAQAGVRLVEEAGVPTLTLLEESAESLVLATDSSGRVSDYLLNYRVSFVLTDGAGKELLPRQSIKLQREYSFDRLNVLAKEKEDEFLRREMRRDAVQQLLRRLATPPAGR